MGLIAVLWKVYMCFHPILPTILRNYPLYGHHLSTPPPWTNLVRLSVHGGSLQSASLKEDSSGGLVRISWDWWLIFAMIEGVLVLLKLLYRSIALRHNVHIFVCMRSLGPSCWKLSQVKIDWLCIQRVHSMCVTRASAANTLADINEAPSPSSTPLTIKRRPE